MARLIKTEKEVEGRYEDVWLVVEEDPLEQWPTGPRTTVGRDTPRADAPQRIRGEARYTADLQLPGMLHAAVLRSPTAAAVTIQILRAFKQLRRDEEFPESTGFDCRRSLFAAIRDAVLCCPDDKPFTTQVPCTYFIQAGADGPIKIGSTRNLIVRLRTVGTMSPIPLRLLGVMKGDHEEDCHVRLAAFRLHGEWFAPSETVKEFIRSNAITSSAREERSGILSEGS